MARNNYNNYYAVVEPFTLYERAAITDSNTHFGASMVYGNVYRELLLPVGTELHLLAGGDFVVLPSAESGLPIRYQLSDKHPFEKTYLPERVAWPFEKLRDLASPTKVRYQRADQKVSRATLTAAGAQLVGRGVDWLMKRRSCVNCHRSVRFDLDREVWRHDERVDESCVSASPGSHDMPRVQ